MRLLRDASAIPPSARGAVVALGNFDGVHLGHRAVIGEAVRRARDLRAPAMVLTFSPHPREFFGGAALSIEPLAAKIRQVRELGVDFLLVKRFDAAFAALTAEAFISRVLVEALGVRHVVTGEDFAFGKGRTGHAASLAEAAASHGFCYTSVPTLLDRDGAPCSSSRIRAHLAAGDMRGASALLGRSYRIEGRVQRGDRRGRLLGFPTANLKLGRRFVPAFGVYAARIHLPDGAWANGVFNLGVRPTFGGQEVRLEVHLFDFDGDLYGKRLGIEPVERLRGERKFDGMEALKAQISADCAQARLLLERLDEPPIRSQPAL